ncbi:MAG: hypothetical protein IPM79_34160 [Polyangiaceae bacterium]|jgi:hypothetical protein|nr:hypothetical protein [Polyangiaceae bacterium]MBK8942510.1 hypothetical protein [Polyangiaceae bacterium]
MKLGFFSLGVALALVALGCDDPDSACVAECPEGGSNAGGSAGDGGAAEGGSNAGGTSQGGGGEGGSTANWSTLMTAEWGLAPGQELTSDVHTIVADRDIFVGGIRPIDPQGTHHTVLALGNLNTGNILYASGVGTNELLFPEGVGFKIPQGETVVLQLHLFNPTGESISGLSGIEIVEIPEAELVHEADLYLPGPLDLSIAPNQQTVESNTCTVGVEQTYFAIFPHMHQLGTHFKATVTVDGVDTVIHDDAYSFDHQAFLPIDPITLSPGDSITTECTWNNTTASTVGWGESSTTEMCFSIVYRYPKQNDAGFCP